MAKTRDARALRYTQAKQAAAKLDAADAALLRATERRKEAVQAFDAVVATAETPEEKTYLMTLRAGYVASDGKVLRAWIGPSGTGGISTMGDPAA